MSKVKSHFSKFLLAFCLVLVSVCFNISIAMFAPVATAISPETAARSTLPGFVAQSASKKELANQVLLSIGIASQYDMYFDHTMGISFGGETINPKENARMREMIVREAGWKYVKDDYVAGLSADFSVAELKELLRLSKLPVMQRLLRSEIQAYNTTSPKRYKLLYTLFDNYINGLVKP
jgi:hypothetical protein